MREYRLLLIEDNAAEAMLLQEAFQEACGGLFLQVCGTGDEALGWLESRLAGGLPLPDLILLDLNLPGMSGREVLTTLKNDPRLRRLPVLVLTTTSEPAEVEAAWDRHANCFLVKPPDLESLLRLVRGISDFWLGLARLPGRRQRPPLSPSREETGS